MKLVSLYIDKWELTLYACLHIASYIHTYYAFIIQVKCDQCNGWVHQVCGDLNPKDVTESFEYNCPECASNTDYA